jgi:hypothetical protein
MKFKKKIEDLIKEQRSDDMKSVFTKIWKSGQWVKGGNIETRCGCGSTLESTLVVSKLLVKIIGEYNIRTITDAACGDLNWISQIDLKIDRYLGYDVVDEMIKNNIKKYKNDVFDFKCEDVIGADLPTSDLIISRYCFQHWRMSDTIMAIKNFQKSQSTYLLATSHSDVDINRNEKWVDLKKSPFNFPEPLISVKENNNFQDRLSNICLWKLSDIKC